jgi:hypothetical protein
LLVENELNDSAADAIDELDRLATADGSEDTSAATTDANKSVDVDTLNSPHVDCTLEFRVGEEISPTNAH